MNFFSNVRSDKGFEEILADANEHVLDLNISSTFPTIQTIRTKKEKRQVDYERFADIVLDSKIHFRIFLLPDIRSNFISVVFKVRRAYKHSTTILAPSGISIITMMTTY